MEKAKVERSREETAYLSGSLREKLLDNSDFDLDAHKDAVIQTKEHLREIQAFKQHMSKEEREKDWRYQRLQARGQNKTLNEAGRTHNLTVLGYARGLPENNKSISQYHRIQEIIQILKVNGRIFHFTGNPDAGKTNQALLFSEMWKKETNGTIYSNLESFRQSKTVKSFKELKERFDNDDGRKLMIIEDASNHLSGYAVDRSDVEKYFRPFKNELAKNNGVLMILGHSGTEVHPVIKRNSLRVHKPSIKVCDFYKTDSKGNKSKKIAQYNGVPKSKYKYDSSEKTEFGFSGLDVEDEETDEERKEKVKKEILSGLKHSNVVKTVEIPFNNSFVAECMRELSKDRQELRFFESKTPKRIVKRYI